MLGLPLLDYKTQLLPSQCCISSCCNLVIAENLYAVAGQVAVVAAQAMQTKQAEASIYAFGVGCAVARYCCAVSAGHLLAGALHWLHSQWYAASAVKVLQLTQAPRL